jgi:protein gp37
VGDQRQGGIAWTETTWNPIRGCEVVSPGCANCYAKEIAARFSGLGEPYDGLAKRTPKGLPVWTGEIRLIAHHLDDPLRWKRPRLVFVNSMSDLFFEKLHDDQIAAIFGVMAAAGRHRFQVLTKRSKRMREWFAKAAADANGPAGYCAHAAAELLADPLTPECYPESLEPAFSAPWPLPNVDLGVSVEREQEAHRIDDLMACPASVRWVSYEPALGPIAWASKIPTRSPWHDKELPSTFDRMLWPDWVPLDVRSQIARFWVHHGGPAPWLRALDGDGSGLRGVPYPAFGERVSLIDVSNERREGRWVYCWNNIGRIVTDDGSIHVAGACEYKPAPRLDWVVIGGESGPRSRPMHPRWAQETIDACRAGAVAVFMKQLGAWRAKGFPLAEAVGSGERAWGVLDYEGNFCPTGTPWNGIEDEAPSFERIMIHVGGHGKKPEEWPAPLRVREYPR